MTAVKNIPTVDLNDYTSGGAAARSRLIETLGGGLSEFGFLNVEGHGIDPALIRTTYDLWKRFLALPDDVKRHYAGDVGGARHAAERAGLGAQCRGESERRSSAEGTRTAASRRSALPSTRATRR